jgi:hypothetical protein
MSASAVNVDEIMVATGAVNVVGVVVALTATDYVRIFGANHLILLQLQLGAVTCTLNAVQTGAREGLLVKVILTNKEYV